MILRWRMVFDQLRWKWENRKNDMSLQWIVGISVIFLAQFSIMKRWERTKQILLKLSGMWVVLLRIIFLARISLLSTPTPDYYRFREKWFEYMGDDNLFGCKWFRVNERVGDCVSDFFFLCGELNSFDDWCLNKLQTNFRIHVRSIWDLRGNIFWFSTEWGLKLSSDLLDFCRKYDCSNFEPFGRDFLCMKIT